LGTNTTFINLLTSSSSSISLATSFISFIIAFALKYPDAAFAPNMNVVGLKSRISQ